MVPRPLRSVSVFCGSANGRSEAYADAARTFAHAAVARGLRIVYGGASVGLMGILANTAIEAGGEVIGVMPRALVDREIAHPGLTELRVVDTMHERKATMAALADAFVALPGGLGTLEELFEVWTWGMLGLHRKPYGLLEVGNYYRSLAEFLDHACREGFVRAGQRAMLCIETDADRLLDRLSEATP